MITLVENGYAIKGIAPPDLRTRDEATKLLYWSWVTELGLRAKDKELSQGLNKDGKPLRAITEATRKHRRSAMTPTGKGDPSAPPLMPGRALSRTRSLLSGRAYPDRAEFWWRFDSWTGDSWAKTLEVQRDRWGRDVFGISPKAQRLIANRALELWDRWKRGLPVAAVRGAIIPMAPAVQAPPPERAGLEAWQTLFRQPAAAAQPGRPGAPGNVLLRHIFGAEGPPKVAAGAVKVEPPRVSPPKVTRVAMGPAAPPKPPKPAPKPVPKPAPPTPAVPPPTAPRTLETTIAANIAAAKSIPEIKAGIIRAIEEHAVSGPTGAFHGMTTPETFRTVNFWGIDWHFTGTAAEKAPIFETIYEYSLFKAHTRIPDRLKRVTRAVYFTGQSNSEDDIWRARYANFSESMATAGDGRIVTYGGERLMWQHFSHESGHNLAAELYGKTTPKGDYGALLTRTKEPAVSKYAANSPPEDFAEAIRVYTVNPDKMKTEFPERYAIIHRLMTESSYGG